MTGCSGLMSADGTQSPRPRQASPGPWLARGAGADPLGRGPAATTGALPPSCTHFSARPGYLPNNPFSVSNTNLTRSTCMGSSMTCDRKETKASKEGTCAMASLVTFKKNSVHEVNLVPNLTKPNTNNVPLT